MTLADRHPLLHVLLAAPDAPPMFRLIGCNAVLREVRRGTMLDGTVPVAAGHTLDGRWQTMARELDIVRLN